MYYGEIKKTDIANGVGVRVSLFVSGCTRHCKNCFNAETWSFTYGKPFTAETEQEILDALAPGYINGLSLLGGEPMECENQRALVPFLRRVRAAYPEKDVWCYTGSTLETDLQKDITLRFRGSSNQRLIDMKQTRQRGEIVLWTEHGADGE